MSIYDVEKKYIFQTYKRRKLALIKGKGKFVWDNKNRKYLDFFSGITVCNLGHCHPKVVEAIKKQASKLIHVSNHYYTQPQTELAKNLIHKSFSGKVFFSNSGAEANECAIKIARKWGKPKGRYEIIVFDNSFHGRTLATLAATGQKKLHKGFEPLVPGFKYARFNDIKSVKKLINKKTAAIMIEPIQGEGGVNLAAKKFLRDLRKICNKHNLLLIFDEIQTGIGRTGRLFGYQTYGVKPDVITLAKSLGSGLPIGATIADRKYISAFVYGDHGSTFGGSLVPCAASNAILKVLTPGFLAKVRQNGGYFLSKLKELKSKYPFIREVRGMGLMVGVELDFKGADIVQSCQGKGLIINCTQEKVLRFLPPLIINRKDIDKAIRIFDSVLRKYK
ncbi:MAG: aspartate aminotransferase family protein [Endomicrobiales bacterium]|nr:aspartate aminotransferase family protein [Endomicrobiales bacterium]